MKKLADSSSLLFFIVITILTTAVTVLAQANGGTTAPKPPMAEKKPKVIKIHGETLTDNYYWLREKSSPAVISHLEAENAYTDAFMKPTESLQENLYKEMVGHIKETDETAPYRWGNYFY